MGFYGGLSRGEEDVGMGMTNGDGGVATRAGEFERHEQMWLLKWRDDIGGSEV